MAERLRNKELVIHRSFSKIERAKSIFGMGVGVGTSLAFTLSFALYEKYAASLVMLFVTVAGGYSANEHLKSVSPDKGTFRTSTLTRYFYPPELTSQKLVMSAGILTGIFSSYREARRAYPPKVA